METSRRDKVRGKMLGSLPKGGVVAEIGVWEGNFSQRILEITEPRELHLVDPWLYQPEFSNTGFGRKKNRDRMDEMFQDVSAKFAANPNVHLHRAKSQDALSWFADGHFDWVYIDGNHNEPFVGEDLELARKKVRPGGIIAGDDYNWQGDTNAPVRTAVGALMERLGPKASMRLMGNQYIITLPDQA